MDDDNLTIYPYISNNDKDLSSLYNTYLSFVDDNIKKSFNINKDIFHYSNIGIYPKILLFKDINKRIQGICTINYNQNISTTLTLNKKILTITSISCTKKYKISKLLLSLVDFCQKKGIAFEYRLYRIHTVVINNDFVKDLSRLGRDLSRIIIVDNMEQNYKLQPENGITIRPFWGKDANDMALIDLLRILVEIAKKNMDVRDGISFFKEDIISKITSNIFRRVQI
jgi:hypothetical protein